MRQLLPSSLDCQRLEVDGLASIRCGRVGTTAVVLIHGGPGACDNLAPLAAMIDDLVATIRFDQRGCGASAGGPTSLEGAVDDLDRIRSAWGVDRWILVGHSWGAALALLYACTHIERTSGLALLSGPGIRPFGGELYRRRRDARLTEEERRQLRDLKEMRRNAPPEEQPGIARAITAITTATDFDDITTAVDGPGYDAPFRHDINAGLNREWDEHCADPRFATTVAALRLPALVVHGLSDPRPSAPAEEVARLLGTEPCLIDGVGHYPWLERPEQLRVQLRGFIASLAG